MTGTTGALAFLIVRTARNRIARQLSRLRSPRYAIAAVLGLGYLVLVFGTQSANSPRPDSGNVTSAFGVLGGIGLALTALVWWLHRAPASALAFQPAEVQLLFPAPLSRHHLMAYKVARSQLVLLLSCVIWTLLARNWGASVGAPLRFASLWALFTVLSLHRIGAALVQVTPVRRARRAVHLLARVAAGAVAAALIYGLAPALLAFRSLGLKEAMSGLVFAVAAPPASIALAPFRLLLAPLFAQSLEAWAGAFGMLMGIAMLHLVWVLGMNVEFEERAAIATATVAKQVEAFKRARAGAGVVPKPGRAKSTRLPLATLGNPALAIVWKNTIALLRQGTIRSTVIILGSLFVISQVVTMSADDSAGPAMALPFASFAFISLLMGPRAVRNDLRQDLQSLALLKSYPLGGTALVAAEMVSPTLVLAGMQCALLLAAYFNLSGSVRGQVAGTTTIVAAVVVPLLLLALNAMSVGIQNATALLFPGWVRLGSDSGGIEAIGQNLLVTLGAFLALMLSLILPVLAGALVAFFFSFSTVLAVAAAGVVCSLLLALETAGLVVMLGNRFERIDPTAL